MISRERCSTGLMRTYVVDVVRRNGDGGVTNAEGEVRKVRIAAEDPSTVEGRVLNGKSWSALVSLHWRVLKFKRGGAYGGTVNIGVVGLDNGSGQVDQGGTSVSNGSDVIVDEVGVTNTVAGGGELPVAGQLGHVSVGQAVREGVVDEAKVVGTSGVVVQVGAEDGLVERVNGVFPAYQESAKRVLLPAFGTGLHTRRCSETRERQCSGC